MRIDIDWLILIIEVIYIISIMNTDFYITSNKVIFCFIFDKINSHAKKLIKNHIFH